MSTTQPDPEKIEDPIVEDFIAKSHRDREFIFPMISRLMMLAVANDPKDILHYVDKACEVLEKWHNDFSLSPSLIHFNRGVIDFYLNHFEEARQKFQTALNLLPAEGASEVEGIIRMLLGTNFRSLGQIDFAVKNLFKAQQLIRKDGSFPFFYIICLYQLGEIHSAINEHNNALHYYEEAEACLHNNVQGAVCFRVYSGLSMCHMHLGNFDKSFSYMNQALNTPNISTRNQSRGWFDLGVLNSKQGNFAEAIHYFTKSYELRKENGLKDASSTSLIYLAKVYLETHQAMKALECLNLASEIVEHFNARSKKILLLILLARTYKLLGDNGKSVLYFEEYIRLYDEERSEQERSIFRFKNELIEEQRKELEKKNVLLNNTLDELANVKRSRLAMVYSFVTVIILVILTELFVDPLIDTYAYNNYISLALKVLIALLLKPIDSFYEWLLFRKAFAKRETES